MSGFYETAPTLPAYSTEDVDAIIAGRRPSMGEYLGASLREGWWGSTLGAVGAQVNAGDASDANPEPLPRHEWEASAYWRQGVPWDDRMTVGRAQAIAQTFDENRYRQHVMTAREPGGFEWGLGFLTQMGGAVADPVNFLPVAGPAARALRFAESASTPLMRAAGRAANVLERPGVVGGFTRGATEGVIGNAVAAPYIYSVQASFGDEVTWGRVVTDLAVGGLIGGGFGAAFGRGGAGRMIEPDPIMATRILDHVATDMAAGRTVEVPTGLARNITEDAVVRAAPPEAAPFLRMSDDGAGTVTYHPDLPTRADGTPLTREEFGAELARRQGTTVEAQRAAARDAERAARDADKAETLVSWLVLHGGLRDDSGDLRAIMGTNRARPGLLNSRGMAPDMAAVRAREAGFFDDQRIQTNDLGREIAPDGLSDRHLYEAIDAELRGLGVRRREGHGIDARPDHLAGERMMAEWDSHVDDAFRWYGEALHAQRSMERMASDAQAEVRERAAIMEIDGGISREEAMVRAVAEGQGQTLKADADPAYARAQREIAAMRAEGRFTAADEALMRAGNDAADEMDSLARGMTEAGACALRTMA